MDSLAYPSIIIEVLLQQIVVQSAVDGRAKAERKGLKRVFFPIEPLVVILLYIVH